MAEGGNFSRTIEGGSDVLHDRECAQCLADHSKQDATHVCQVCKQYLCQTCGRYHVRNMTDHTLISVELFSQSAMGSPVPLVAKCHYHPDRDIEMYCGTHDMVYCSLCVAKDHRSCRRVKEVGEVTHTALLSTLQILAADIAIVNQQLLDTKLEKSNDLQNLKTKKVRILKEISEVRDLMNNHLDVLEYTIIAKLEADENQLEKEINAEIKIVEDLMTAFDKQKPDLSCNYNGNQMFIIEKLGRAALANANAALEKAKLSNKPSLEFKRNDVLCEVIEQSDSIGRVIRKYSRPAGTIHSKYSVKSVKQKTIRVNSDKKFCCINDICRVSDGTFILADCSNKRLKKLNKQFKVNKFLDFKTEPLGLCSVSTDEVVIGLDGENLAFSYIDLQNFYTHKRTPLENLAKAE